MYKSKYFTMVEMTDSNTARLNKIDNAPTEEHEKNLKELMDFLDSLREYWKGPIRVTSGYRSEKLNEKVGGVKTSAHNVGYAADLKPYSNDMDKFMKVAKEWIEDKDFDEFIEEKDDNGGHWLHIALKSIKGLQRKKIKSIKK